MKFTEFISEIIKSFWAWAGLLMDILSGIVYVNPNLIETFTFLNVIQKHLFLWVSLGTFLIIWSAWKVTDKILKEREKIISTNHQIHIEENNASFLNNSNGNTFNTQNNDVKVIISDPKKKENLNKLDRLVQEIVADIVNSKIYSDRVKQAKQRANEFFEFSQGNRAEMTSVLDKLVFNEMFPEIINKVLPIIENYWTVFLWRKDLIISKVKFEDLPRLPDIQGVEEKIVIIQDKIHAEIYRILNP